MIRITITRPTIDRAQVSPDAAGRPIAVKIWGKPTISQTTTHSSGASTVSNIEFIQSCRGARGFTCVASGSTGMPVGRHWGQVWRVGCREILWVSRSARVFVLVPIALVWRKRPFLERGAPTVLGELDHPQVAPVAAHGTAVRDQDTNDRGCSVHGHDV